MATATATMYREWADQYDCPAVVLTAPADADEVIEFAREIGAEGRWECEPDEPSDLVISFEYIDRRFGRAIGPEVYSEEAARSTLQMDVSTIPARTPQI